MATPTNAVFQRPVNLLAADTTTFAGTTDGLPAVGLLTSDFTPSPNMTFAEVSLLEAVFEGYVGGGIGAASGTQNTAVDPLTGDYLLQLKTPAGGFRWETGGGYADTIAITGFAIWQFGDGVLLATERLPTTLILNGPNQVIEIESPQLRYLVTGVQ